MNTNVSASGGVPVANNPKRPKRWMIVAGAVAVMLVLLVLILPYLLDVDRYRPMIVQAIQKQTGRTATLGKIHARLFPQIGVVIQGFQLGNPAGFPAGNLIAADEVRANLAFGPLLHGVA